VRWLQHGVFQPIFRTHMSTGGDPWFWDYDPTWMPAMRGALQLRSALMPYLYAAAAAATHSGVQPVHPLYYAFAEEPDAYAASLLAGPGVAMSYFFGDALVASPITSPFNASAAPANASDVLVPWRSWVPPGRWCDWFTGELVTGPAWRSRSYTILETPLLARAGAVVPMKALADAPTLAPTRLLLAVAWAAGAAGSALVYEDDGASLLYREGAFATLVAAFDATAPAHASLSVAPGADGGGYAGAPAQRTFEARFRGAPVSAANVSCAGCAKSWSARWDAEGALAVFVVDSGSIAAGTTVTIGFDF
jgi:alpha-glucosidase (family GH31 glycosyl hydrolase)